MGSVTKVKSPNGGTDTLRARARSSVGSKAYILKSGCQPSARPAGAGASANGKALANVVAPLNIYIARQVARAGGSDLESLVGVPLAELRRHKRVFLKLSTQNVGTRLQDRGAARRLFADYLRESVE